MKEHFLLQYKMANRRLSYWGINPLIGYILLAVGFVFVTEYLFITTQFAKYIVPAVAIHLLTKAAEINRNEFLQVIFGNIKYRKIRVIENVIICLPFSSLLLYHNAIIESIGLLTVSILLAGFSFKARLNFAIPTPFYKKPFEFIVGFRNTFYLFPLAYALAIIAVSVDNMNLGIFAMLSVFLIAAGYYTKPENEYFVWSYSTTPLTFILDKIKTATTHVTYLALPIAIGIAIFYPAKTDTILMYILLGYAFLGVIVLAKYGAYPNPIGLPEGVLLAFCIYYPPVTIAIMPYLYYKCIKSLNRLLK